MESKYYCKILYLKETGMFFIDILFQLIVKINNTYSKNCLKCNIKLDCFSISCSNVSKLTILENDSLRVKQILNIYFPSLLVVTL